MGPYKQHAHTQCVGLGAVSLICACVWHSVITTYQILWDRLANAHNRYAIMLLGGSDGVVNSLDF